MRYVQRDPATKEVIAHFANPQSYAQEELSDDHPDILAFKARMEASRAPLSSTERIDREMLGNPFVRGLVRMLAQQRNITPEQVIEAIKQRAD